MTLAEHPTLQPAAEEGRVHHLQGIMGFFKKGKAEILLAWRLGKPSSGVKTHVLRRATGESPSVLSSDTALVLL